MKYGISLVVCIVLLGAGCRTAEPENTRQVNDANLAYEAQSTDEYQAEDAARAPAAPSRAAPHSLTPPTMSDTSRTIRDHSDLAAEYSKAILHTSLGDITVSFYGDLSPKTVNNFLNLAKAGAYDGTRFHRVIKDFMIQGGDPLSKDDSKAAMWGTGGPDYRFEDEINAEPLVRGSLAMANAGPGTNGSQFFIVTLEATPWLDGKHTNFGSVIEGMHVVDAIENSATGQADRPLTPITIESIELIP